MFDVGDKLICKVPTTDIFAPNEVVEIEQKEEHMLGAVVIYKLKGYSRWYSRSALYKIFTKYTGEPVC